MNGMEVYLGASPFVAMSAAFAGGFLASLSPCIYPLIPIVSTYVASRSAGEKTRLKSFYLSLSYVIGMATVYALLGMIAAVTGSFFGQIATSSWALLIVGNILMLLSLHMLEVVPFPSWQPKFIREPAAGGVLGAFLVGAASGLVASPCTSPVLFGLLTYIATSHSLLYGATLMFAFSLGMGSLLVVIGTFSGLATALPKPGRWMVLVKKVLGLLMLVLAEYYLVRAGQAW